MKIHKIILFVFVFGLFSVQGAFAQLTEEEAGIRRIGQNEFKEMKGVRIGKASLKAGVSVEERYDSNIFLTSNDKKGDYLNILSPKFLLDLPFGIDERHLAQLMYGADVGSYSDERGQNYVNQDLAGNLNLRLPFGYFNVQDDYLDTVDRAQTEFTTQVHRKQNTAQTTLGVEMNKLTYEIGYTNFNENYVDEQFQPFDYTEHIFSTTAFYQMLPKTKALLEYDRGVIRYIKDQTRDGNFNQVMTGLKGNITGKTVGIVKVGFQSRDYDVMGRSGFSGFVSEAGTITKFSDRTNLTLKYINTAVESTYANNNYYNANEFRAELEQKLMGNYSVLLASQYDRNRYPEFDPTLDVRRHDTILTEGLTLQYKIKDLGKASLGYEYKEDISNIDNLDYNRNLVFLRFDLLL
ncbi:MAG: outer membrane beta-barrel protein [Candidatus Omnitrophica bacterium]|nr:outer membrane beta-barrel protein [Candidatus Omnitrophota bacterium]